MTFLSLFVTSFLAGSFFPMGSEAHFLYLQHQNHALWALIGVASAGNTLGGFTCYLIARFGGRPFIKKYLKYEDQKIDEWQNKLKNKSEFTAFFCWLPFVGEMIATVLGLLESNPKKVIFYMYMGKLLRYLALAGIWNYFSS